MSLSAPTYDRPVSADELIERARHYPGLWCRFATYASRGGVSTGRRNANARWPNVEFSTGARQSLWARWPGPATDATPEPHDDPVFTVADRYPKPGTEATLATDARIDAAQATPGVPVKVATYATPGGAWKAVNKQLPKRYEHQAVTFKSTTAGRENAVWATWETT